MDHHSLGLLLLVAALMLWKLGAIEQALQHPPIPAPPVPVPPPVPTHEAFMAARAEDMRRSRERREADLAAMYARIEAENHPARQAFLLDVFARTGYPWPPAWPLPECDWEAWQRHRDMDPKRKRDIHNALLGWSSVMR
jgi:hypothetical protein